LNCFTNKRIVYYLAVAVLHKRRNANLILTFVITFAGLSIYAQDTTSLPAVDVTSKKISISATGKKTDKLDTNVRGLFIYSSLADVLSLNSSVYIKNYGPGSLSSSALRGGNASQTAVLWNGFNIQNTMLGQIDLALLPTVLFDDVTVEYGGSSSLWGTGAVAGSIHLMNSSVFNKGTGTKVNLSSGSFGLFNASTNVIFSKAKFYSSTKAYLNNSTNNFKYLDTLNREQQIREQKHASYSFKGILQEFKFFLNSKQSLSVNAWYNLGQRQIPSFNINKTTSAYQVDDNFKTTINWNYFTQNFNSTIKGAFFNDIIKYKDTLLLINSNSRAQSFIFENENIFSWNKHYRLNFGMNLTSALAESNNYDGTKTLSKAAVLVGNEFLLADKRLIIYPVVRAEYFSVGTLPVTGNVSFVYYLFKNVSAKLNAAKVYRQPTFNELYWQPGGNINLKPEQGYTYEGEILFEKDVNHVLFSVSGAAYSRIIDNWILWLPGAGSSPTPVNIQQVWSRGTETKTKIEYIKNKFRLSLNVLSSYVLSTVNSSSQENGDTKDKQLIYTPRYTINSNVSLAYGGTSITYYHQYVGYRFITSDNTQWLSPYYYSGLRLNFKTLLKEETKVILFAACNNLYNANYTIVSGRYMPLRNFEIGITLNANKPNKIKQIQTEIK